MNDNICEVTPKYLLKFWTEIFRDENQNTEYRLEASIQLARYLGMFSEKRINFNIK